MRKAPRLRLRAFEISAIEALEASCFLQAGKVRYRHADLRGEGTNFRVYCHSAFPLEEMTQFTLGFLVRL
jgi:phage/plasmid primase-like uncharacterized protein